jgi:hypothetical protein
MLVRTITNQITNSDMNKIIYYFIRYKPNFSSVMRQNFEPQNTYINVNNACGLTAMPLILLNVAEVFLS